MYPKFESQQEEEVSEKDDVKNELETNIETRLEEDLSESLETRSKDDGELENNQNSDISKAKPTQEDTRSNAEDMDTEPVENEIELDIPPSETLDTNSNSDSLEIILPREQEEMDGVTWFIIYLLNYFLCTRIYIFTNPKYSTSMGSVSNLISRPLQSSDHNLFGEYYLSNSNTIFIAISLNGFKLLLHQVSYMLTATTNASTIVKKNI